MNTAQTIQWMIDNDYIIKNDEDFIILKTEEIPISLGFQDIAIAQNKNICRSRLDVDISSEVLRGLKLNIPIIASNMTSTSSPQYSILLDRLGGLGVLHRARQQSSIIDDIKYLSKNIQNVAISIGVGHIEKNNIKESLLAGANIVFIDIAHGYSETVIEMAKYIKHLDSNVFVVVGNTTNKNILLEVADFADAVKVGIAQGFACDTKSTAGCAERQFSSVLSFKHMAAEIGMPIISDGGIREPADFVKAIAAGANSIMAGSIMASCSDSPAESKIIDGKNMKVYSGMASENVQTLWKGKVKPGTCAEGSTKYLNITTSTEKLFDLYAGALRTGVTYGGGSNIKSFQEKVKFVKLISSSR